MIVGVAYFSLHVHRHLCFGNYLGGKPAWRSNRRAEFLVEECRRRLVELDPALDAIVFEVEAIDHDLLAAAACADASQPPTWAMIANVRRMRRRRLYQGFGARALLTGTGAALRCVQSAMREPLGPENEREAVVMAAPVGGRSADRVDSRRVLAFLYDDVYADAYGGSSAAAIDRFGEYVAVVERRVVSGLDDGCCFGQIRVPMALQGAAQAPRLRPPGGPARTLTPRHRAARYRSAAATRSIVRHGSRPRW